MTPIETLRAAATRLRELAENATAGPWRVGDDQYIAGVNGRLFGEGRCAYCDTKGEPTWEGRRDINGEQMLAHVHASHEPHWEHGIYAERPDGHEVVVMDSDEYGYVTKGDATLIATMDPDLALALADWLEVVADYGVPRAGHGTRNYAAALAVAKMVMGDE